MESMTCRLVIHQYTLQGITFRIRYNGQFISFMAQQPQVGHGFLVVETSRSHADTLQTVGLPRASDQPEAETFILQQTPTKEIKPCTRLDSNSQSQQVSGRK